MRERLRTIITTLKDRTSGIPHTAGVAVIAAFMIGLGTMQILSPAQEVRTSVYAAFVGEVYEVIQQNYWEEVDEAELASVFRRAAEEITEQPQPLSSRDRAGVERLIERLTDRHDTHEEKRDLVTSISDMVLANLQPFGRSRLFTTQREQELRDTVQHIDRDTDLYAVLGVDESAGQEDIVQRYEEQRTVLEEEGTPESHEQLAQLERAFQALAEPEERQIYDEVGAEPTVIGRLVRPEILHLRITNVSPITFEEFQRVAARFDQEDTLDTLILDLRGNQGGAIDILPYFLGPFVGAERHAFEYYSQGEYIPHKTTIGWMPELFRYKKVVILIDEETQSSAEVIAASLKKFNVGVVVGTPTRGWGTIERVFPLETQLDPDENYSAFLVHTITLRDDRAPIEGRGVDPLVDIRQSGWQDELLAYFHYPELVSVVGELVNN